MGKIMFSFLIFSGLLAFVDGCAEIRNSQIVAYKTNRHALFKEGQVEIPVAIDLIEYYTICGNRYQTDTLAGLFKSTTEKKERDKAKDLAISSKRSKRFAALFAGGITFAAAAWAGLSYSKINGRVEELRADLTHTDHYLKKIALDAQNENLGNFVVIRREMSQLSTRASQMACKVERNTSLLIFEHYFLQEFDDIISALHNQKLTTKIIPPAQLYQLLKQIPILDDSIYMKEPFLLYYAGKISFNINEIEGNIIRAILYIPIIKRLEPVLMHIGVRKFEEQLKLFTPVYIAEASELSVEGCVREIDNYFCTDSDLKEVQMIEMTQPYFYDDGIFLLNHGNRATIKDLHKNSSFRAIVGISVCDHEDTSTVIINDKLIYTQSAALHVKQPAIDFSVNPYPVTFHLAKNLVHELETRLSNTEFKTTALHGSHFSVTAVLLITLVTALIMIYYKFRQQTVMIKATNRNDIPLQEIVVIEDPTTGRGRVRHLSKA